MKKVLVNMLILGALLLSANATSTQGTGFDGPAPYPCGPSPLPACQPGQVK